MPHNEQAMADAFERIVHSGKRYAYEFVYEDWETNFLRFYDSQPNYNLSKRSVSLSVTVEKDKKKTSFTLSDPSPESLSERVEAAKALVETLPPDPDFSGFETDRTAYRYAGYPDSIASVPLETKLGIVSRLSSAVEAQGFGLYGTFITLKVRRRIVNSTGLDKVFYQSPFMLDTKAVSRANMVTVVESAGGDGGSFGHFDETGFTAKLTAKVSHAKLPVIDAAPGNYRVILAPHALLEFLEYFLAGAEGSVLDSGESFFEGKTGKKIFPESVSIFSDPENPRVVKYPYNSDGHIAKKLPLVEKGVFRNFILDKYYADKLKMKNNGSAGSRAIVFGEGDVSLEKMIAGIDRGLYISTIHYMNFIDLKETSVTGLTRDGTFLIENGKIANVVNNLRYTVKISDIFENVSAVENVRHAVPRSDNYDEFSVSCGLVPHVLTEKFSVSSSTGTI